MSDKARKKEKQRLKRLKKRNAIRKAGSVSPYKKAAGGELVACLVNGDWRERGQAVPFVLRRAPGVGLVMATFMVDTWCAGLKDAWGRARITREEFDEVVDRMDGQMDGTFMPAPLSEVAGIVAGSVRFAVQNGFRLPAHYQRWLAFLGPEAQDWKNADLSAFGVEGGKIRWVGPMFDLRRRLVGCSAEEFLARTDVEFVAGFEEDFGDVPFEADEGRDEEDDDDWDEEDLEEEVEEAGRALDAIAHKLADAVRRWCFARGERPSEQLDLALSLVLFTGASDIATEEGGEIKAPPGCELAMAAMERRLANMAPAAKHEVNEGARQVRLFMEQYKGPAEMFKAAGLPVPTDLPGLEGPR